MSRCSHVLLLDAVVAVDARQHKLAAGLSVRNKVALVRRLATLLPALLRHAMSRVLLMMVAERVRGTAITHATSS